MNEADFFQLLSLALRETPDVDEAVQVALLAGGAAGAFVSHSGDLPVTPGVGPPASLPVGAQFGYTDLPGGGGRGWYGAHPPGEGWTPYKVTPTAQDPRGSKGGQFWKRAAGRERSKVQPSVKPQKPEVRINTPEQFKARLLEIVTKGDKATDSDVVGAATVLSQMTVKDIQKFKKEFGYRASGVKAELALKVADQALARARSQGIESVLQPKQPGAQQPQPEVPQTTQTAPESANLPTQAPPPQAAPPPVQPPATPPVPEPVQQAPEPPQTPMDPPPVQKPPEVAQTPPAPPQTPPEAPKPPAEFGKTPVERQEKILETLMGNDPIKVANIDHNEFNDFKIAVMRGDFGPAAQAAGGRALDEWLAKGGKIADKRETFAAELAKMRQPEAAPPTEEELTDVEIDESPPFIATPDAAGFSDAFAEAIDAAGLTPRESVGYKAAVDRVFKAMPKASLERAQKSLKAISIFKDFQSLTDAFIGEYEKDFPNDPFTKKFRKQIDDGAMMAGSFSKESGELRGDGLGGQEKIGIEGMRFDIEGAYAHEMAHAVDLGDASFISGAVVFGKMLSDDNEWKQAWDKEMVGGGFTAYAKTSAEEGFAEFGRALYAGHMSADDLRQFFPKSAAFFEKHGLLEAKGGPAETAETAGTEGAGEAETGHPGTVQPEHGGAGRDDPGHDQTAVEGGVTPEPAAPEESVTPGEVAEGKPSPESIVKSVWPDATVTGNAAKISRHGRTVEIYTSDYGEEGKPDPVMNVSFKDEGKSSYGDNPEQLRKGSVDLLHDFKKLLAGAHQQGIGIEFETGEDQRTRIYTKQLTRSGFEVDEDGIWRPKKGAETAPEAAPEAAGKSADRQDKEKFLLGTGFEQADVDEMSDKELQENWNARQETGTAAPQTEVANDEPTVENIDKAFGGRGQSLEAFKDKSLPIKDRIHRVADLDTTVLDPLYRAGLLTPENGFKGGNNELLRTLDVFASESDPSSYKNDKGRRDRMDANTERFGKRLDEYVAGLRKLADDGAMAEDMTPEKLRLAANYYETAGREAVNEFREAIGLKPLSKAAATGLEDMEGDLAKPEQTHPLTEGVQSTGKAEASEQAKESPVETRQIDPKKAARWAEQKKVRDAARQKFESVSKNPKDFTVADIDAALKELGDSEMKDNIGEIAHKQFGLPYGTGVGGKSKQQYLAHIRKRLISKRGGEGEKAAEAKKGAPVAEKTRLEELEEATLSSDTGRQAEAIREAMAKIDVSKLNRGEAERLRDAIKKYQKARGGKPEAAHPAAPEAPKEELTPIEKSRAAYKEEQWHSAIKSGKTTWSEHAKEFDQLDAFRKNAAEGKDVAGDLDQMFKKMPALTAQRLANAMGRRTAANTKTEAIEYLKGAVLGKK